MSDEHIVAAQTFGLSLSQLQKLTTEAVDYVFDEALKSKIRQKLYLFY